MGGKVRFLKAKRRSNTSKKGTFKRKLKKNSKFGSVAFSSVRLMFETLNLARSSSRFENSNRIEFEKSGSDPCLVLVVSTDNSAATGS